MARLKRSRVSGNGVFQLHYMKGALHSAHSLHIVHKVFPTRTSSPQVLMDCHRHSPTSTISNLFLHIEDLLHSLFYTLTQNSRNQFTNPLFLWKKRLKLLCYSTRSNTLRTPGTFPLDLQSHTFFSSNISTSPLLVRLRLRGFTADLVRPLSSVK